MMRKSAEKSGKELPLFHNEELFTDLWQS